MYISTKFSNWHFQRNIFWKMIVLGNRCINLRLFTNYASQCQGQCRDKQGQSRDKQGQGRDKQGQAGTNREIPFLSLLVPTCSYLSLSVHTCPCLSLSVPVCPCLSLSMPVCPSMSLHCYTFISTPVDDYNSLRQY